MGKAVEIAELLLPAFESPTGIPYAMFNARTGTARNWAWASGGCSILSKFGSLHLEFEYLSRIINRTIFSEKVARIREVLSSIEKPEGLYPNYLNPETGEWGPKHVSVGAFGDSFYEYLLKSWLLSNKQDDETEASMNEASLERKSNALRLAEQIANTCHESYVRSAIGIGPESFRFTEDAEAVAVSDREKYYTQRPEVIETWFYLWRATHDEKYREWCWCEAQAIEKHCQTKSGYSGIRNVYTTNVELDDVQQSFILAETFKYLFLVFSDDGVLPLGKWVFNTEAHPIPIASAV
ncbi:unnamed protein product [Toxocara canis]|uniref:alpha-1,2-Mannosidase n=1 Tax=Toxocara canis TaxID=6265 RepID=A0A183U112_TOXCA|nr:unnamed protein product [Toxocara canis]